MVDQAAEQLGFRPGTPVDTELVRSILKEELYLEGFEAFSGDMERLTRGKITMDSLVDAIKSAIRRRHPPILAFLEEIVPTGALKVSGDQEESVRRLLHRLLVVESLGQSIVESPDFLEGLHAHVLKVRAELGLEGGCWRFFRAVWKASGTLFETAKTLTLELVIDQYLGWRREGPGPLGAFQRFRKNLGLKVNVLEAVLEGCFRGYRVNAHLGTKLLFSGVRAIEVVPETLAVKQLLPPGWTIRYESWNLAFILGNLRNLDLLLPKLLVPTVLDAEEDDYLFRRGVLLWFMVNATLFNLRVHGANRPQTIPIAPELARALARANASLSTEQLVAPSRD